MEVIHPLVHVVQTAAAAQVPVVQVLLHRALILTVQRKKAGKGSNWLGNKEEKIEQKRSNSKKVSVQLEFYDLSYAWSRNL